jgi:predicted SAM-dependent methyltransferase
MIKLNLGCGKDVKEGWCNCDKYPINDRVLKLDLAELPLPFPNEYADEILLSHVLEHLVYRTEFMHEIARVLKPGGRVTVVLPCFNPGLDHKSVIHTKITMSGFCKDSFTTHGSPKPFSSMDFKYGWGSPILFLKNLWILIKTLYHSNLRWEFKK